MSEDVYERLATHLSTLGMGMPDTPELIDILKANFTPADAEVAMLLPTRVTPLRLATVDEIARGSELSRGELETALQNLVDRGLLFAGKTRNGKRGYALQQVGYGFPQSFFWKGEETPHARKMAEMMGKYFSRDVTRAAFGGSQTKPSRYVPVGQTIARELQAVYPYHTMEAVVEQATSFALVHCPCRVTAKLRGRPCGHPLEVCIKFDDLAEYVIERGLGKRITRQEALDVIRKSEDAGLVHFVDNAMGQVKHNCNCCGCACFNVGAIRRRKIPRDILMATYFMRVTDADTCTGCGACAEACPVEAIKVHDVAGIDTEWCIGCGVCITRCPTGAARLEMRKDTKGRVPARTFDELHETILVEKGLRKTGQETSR